MFFFRRALLAAALLGGTLSSHALADGSSPSFPFAATATAAGGVGFLDEDNSPYEVDVYSIVAGGQFVVPITGFWNVQFGGAWRAEFLNDNSDDEWTETSFNATAMGFWRDPMSGAYGIETGFFSPNENPLVTYVKIGGVAEFYFGEQASVTGFGGALVPALIRDTRTNSRDIATGFYAGINATWYASSNVAWAMFGTAFSTGESSFTDNFGTLEREFSAYQAGANVRYLTSMPGVEIFASAAYFLCTDTSIETGQTPFERDGSFDGAEIMFGTNIRLGGRANSLVEIDRSNAIDTSIRSCLNVRR